MRPLQILPLALCLPLCSARSRSFNIHEDLLAFPQFEVLFSNDLISEKDAQSLLDSQPAQHAYSTGSSSSSSPSQSSGADADADANDGSTVDDGAEPPLSFEVLSMAPHRYLCSIPMVQPSGPENQTAAQLAEAEEARELSRAVANGWGLLKQLDDSCLYFMSGWWSYRFCNNREIVQFHALTAIPDGQPPRRDPHTAEYVLGRTPAVPEADARGSGTGGGGGAGRGSAPRDRVPAELQSKGDQRFLVQRLGGGTVCDLTGRERTVEVQYHCAPGLSGDRIGWIKEVTICAYVMIVNTPRLCSDVTFLPPRETRANPITCRPIGDPSSDHGSAGPLLLQPPLLEHGSSPVKEDAARHLDTAPHRDGQQGITVGGVVVGGRRVISAADQEGQPPARLAPPRGYLNNHPAAGAGAGAPQERVVEVLVQVASKEDGGGVEALSDEELEKLDLQPELIEEFREQMRDLAGDLGWQLEIVELAGDGDLRELRGWIHEEEDAEEEEVEEEEGDHGRKKKKKAEEHERHAHEAGKAMKTKAAKKKNSNNNNNHDGKGRKGAAKKDKNAGRGKEGGGKGEGSEERLRRDEL